jgi:hypothetical protein
MHELDRQPIAAALADRALRPQAKSTQLPRQRRVGALEAEQPQLAQQHGRVQVRIVLEPARHIVAERLEHTRPSSTLTLSLATQPRPHGLAIAAGVAGDRADRPAPMMKRNDLHHVLP